MKPTIFTSDFFVRTIGDKPPLGEFGARLLAEGDSWFTLGSLNLFQASNLLNEMQFARNVAIVSCAYPGDTLQHIVSCANGPHFNMLLRKRNFAMFWEAVLLSAGGNDLIDAAQQRATNADGSPAPLDARILLTPAEADAVNPGVNGPARFISDAGWARLQAYLAENFADLVRRRDDGPSKGQPMLAHTYHVPVVRPSGTVGAGEGWLHPALLAYGFAPDERQGVAQELFDRLRALLLSLDADSGSASALPNFHVFDSATRTPLTPSDPASTGKSGDWVNEIHPTPAGYAKIGAQLGPWIEGFLPAL